MPVNEFGYPILSTGGPYPRLRLCMVVKAQQGAAVEQLVDREGKSFTQAAAILGLSRTTAWRRYWWWHDWTLPSFYGKPLGPVPPQRATRAVPRGRPYIRAVDGWRDE